MLKQNVEPDVVRARLSLAFFNLDIFAEVERHTSTRLHPARSGKQASGACPYDDCSVDEDGFTVWPALTERGAHYHCRGCKRTGDILKLVQDIRHVRFTEACNLLAIPNPYRDEDQQEVVPQCGSNIRPSKASTSIAKAELDLLHSVYPHMQEALRKQERAQAYLAQRGLDLGIATRYGLGYIPIQVSQKVEKLRLWGWNERIIFPTQTLDGTPCYAGRSLFLWTPGMDEEEHKHVLDTYNAQAEAQQLPVVPRWKYSRLQGFFNLIRAFQHTKLVFVEGAFDALACLACGIEHVVSIGTTGIDASAIPLHVDSVVMALDTDKAGRQASKVLSKALRRNGLSVQECLPATGKDWNEAFRLYGREGLLPLLESQADTISLGEKQCQPIEEAELGPQDTPEPAQTDRCLCSVSVKDDPDVGRYLATSEDQAMYQCSSCMVRCASIRVSRVSIEAMKTRVLAEYAARSQEEQEEQAKQVERPDFWQEVERSVLRNLPDNQKDEHGKRKSYEPPTWAYDHIAGGREGYARLYKK